MNRLSVACNDEGIWLHAAPLAEAHGAEGWTLPGHSAEGQVLGTWAARGDVIRTAVDFVRTEPVSDGSAELWSHGDWQSAWAKGEMLLAPWVSWLARGELPEVQAWEVVPHIAMLPVRTPTLPPATHTNTFLIGDEEFVLVEPAPIDPAERDLMVRWVRLAEARGRRCRAVFATHHHHDHVGGLEIASELGVPLWAHAETARRIPTRVDRLIGHDERLEIGTMTFRAIHTPGHAPGHLCLLHEATRTLIAGDMVAGVGTILIEPGEGDMAEYLDSLRGLLGLDAKYILPAHGGVIANPRACLQHYIDHRERREAQVLAALRNTGQTIQALLPAVYGDVPQQVWPLASLSLRAHLDKLVTEGRVRSDADRFALC